VVGTLLDLALDLALDSERVVEHCCRTDTKWNRDTNSGFLRPASTAVSWFPVCATGEDASTGGAQRRVKMRLW